MYAYIICSDYNIYLHIYKICCDKVPEKNQFKGGRGFDSQFENTALMMGKPWLQEPEGTGHTEYEFRR